MTAAKIIGMTLASAGVGATVGAWWGDRQPGDNFGIDVMFGMIGGAGIGGVVGLITSAVWFT